MPPFPERESSILAKLKKKRPDKVSTLLEPRAKSTPTPNNNKAENQVSSAALPNVINRFVFLTIV